MFLDDDGENGGLELMTKLTFNPVLLTSTVFVDNEGNGYLDLSQGGYAVEVTFRIGIPQ